MSELAQNISRPRAVPTWTVAWLRDFVNSRGARLALRWGLLVYLSLVLCPIRYMGPSNAGIDNTWYFALNYAAAHHLIMGQNIAWTWGPLFYLLFPFDIGQNLAWGFAFQSAVWVLVILVLWDLFFRGGFPLRNLLIFTVLIGLSSLDYNQMAYPGNLFLYPALVLLVHFRLRGGVIRYLAALAIIGLMPLIQIFGVLISVGVLSGLIADFLLRDRRHAGLNIVLAVGVPAAISIGGCRLALGSFHTIAAYLKWNLELTSGYSIAMSTAGPRVELVAALEGVALLGGALFLLMLRNCELSRFFALIFVAPIAMNLKHGFVRQDLGHITVFFCFLALAIALVILAIPLNERFMIVGSAVVLLFLAILWQDYSAASDLESAIASVSGISAPSRVWNAAHFARLRKSLYATARANNSAETRLEPEMKQIVNQETTAFLSNTYSSALLDDLNLVLFPVLQRYSAYTPYLDQLDATWIDNYGPQFLIFDGLAIDGRHPWMETPATWAEVYRWYDTRKLGARDLLLQRREHPRFTQFEPLSHRTVRFGEPLIMPDSSEPLFWSVHCPLSRIGHLKGFLTRVPATMMDLNEPGGKIRSFRVMVPQLGSASLGNYLPSSLAEFAEIFSEPKRRSFSVAKVEFRSLGTSPYKQECDVTFFRALP